MSDDVELQDAIVAYAVTTGSACTDEFVHIITAELLRRGRVTCDRCGLTMRQHVLAALRAGGKHLNHKFANVGQ